MGYFSNGSEGDSFEERNCNRCVHSECCPVLVAHQLYNYKQFGETPEAIRTKELLDLLLPRDPDGFTTECPMFHLKTAEEDAADREARSRITGVNKPAPWMQDFLAKKAEAKP